MLRTNWTRHSAIPIIPTETVEISAIMGKKGMHLSVSYNAAVRAPFRNTPIRFRDQELKVQERRCSRRSILAVQETVKIRCFLRNFSVWVRFAIVIAQQKETSK